MSNTPINKSWTVFELAQLLPKVQGNTPKIHEFLRSASLSISVYHLPAGSRDMQAPHFEDEVYIVVQGKAKLMVDDREQQVSPGHILFVRATTEHSFFDIEEDLTVLAVFGTAAGK